MKLDHPQLIQSLKTAYSAEKAAAYAYIGHANSLRKSEEIVRVRQIEKDEWDHRDAVLKIMQEYDIEPSSWYETKFAIIGRCLSLSCYVIGWFMPYFFAGKLESGNVCEYFVMMRYFRSLGITKHDEVLYEMGVREKEHEVYFADVIKDSCWLPYFEYLFKWGPGNSQNDVDMDELLPIKKAGAYCKNYKPRHVNQPEIQTSQGQP